MPRTTLLREGKMNEFRKAGILLALMGLLAFGWVNLDADARAQRATSDTGLDECLGHGPVCSMDMTSFAYPVGDGLVVTDYF